MTARHKFSSGLIAAIVLALAFQCHTIRLARCRQALERKTLNEQLLHAARENERLSGLIAFLTYVAVHLFYLGGVGGRRITVAITAIGSLFGARESRVIEGELASSDRPRSIAEPQPSDHLT